jgi:signal transduction histidine kinase
MNKLYLRNFALTACMILISFTVLGGAFLGLSYSYTISERTEALETDAQYVSVLLGGEMELGMSASDERMMKTMQVVSMISDVDVFLTDANGTVIYYTDGSEGGTDTTYQGRYINSGVLSQLQSGGSYSGVTSLDLYPKPRVVSGSPVTVRTLVGSSVVGYVLVSTQSAALLEMWHSFLLIFVTVALVVFALAMVFSYICSVRLTKPLQEMATAVRRFGQGEFDVRVQDPGKTEEVAQLATAFNNMADSLAQSETRRQEFVANISHELKTPMTTISGFTDGILDGTIPPEKSREYLQVVSAETKRLARLVRKMLDISKLQSKQNVVGHEQFDLCEIMCQMLLSLEGKINARHLDMDVQMPEEPVKVWGEPDAITQVGYNLMDNAIKFSPEGGVIGLQIATKDGKAYVTVCNRGPTIPAEELPLIFDRFHKSDKSRSMDKDGVGLGLYIVKTILNNHKEDITVTSENGVTSFTFTMTLAR